MYEKNGEKYFVVDSHMHFWDASRENWVEGRENLAKGWIDCFYGYHTLAPPETHWDWEHYLKVSEEDLMKDVFEDGYVDKAIFQSTYLKYWYKDGFNTVEQNGSLLEKHPDKFIVNGRWDPRDGDAGLAQLEEDAKRWNLKGVKLYTAEWHENGSRGWKLTDTESYRFLEKCRELGITNIHAHKGPTIWPLNKDAFSMEDVDQTATDFPDLNFIIEHAGIPRIDDFAYMAVQEPNVYAGLSVVIGAHMYARPKSFAKFMGELLFWVGEDRLTFGSDYNIWTPKWQVEGFVDWQMPDDEAFSDYPRLTTATKKKILGINAAKLYGIDVPLECQIPTTAGEPMQPGEELEREMEEAHEQPAIPKQPGGQLADETTQAGQA
jgi:predicted TIM-barrel fold metal-dependent hydrolase